MRQHNCQQDCEEMYLQTGAIVQEMIAQILSDINNRFEHIHSVGNPHNPDATLYINSPILKE